jgi:SNF2 family DNA or RNA helicase
VSVAQLRGRVSLGYSADRQTIVAAYPYSPQVNAAVKDIPGRIYNPERKQWSFPVDPGNVLAFREALVRLGWGLTISDDLKDELNRIYRDRRDAASIRTAGDSDLAFDYHTTPYAHQRAGLAFLAKLGGGALFWEMGLGKTKTAIDYAELLERQLMQSISAADYSKSQAFSPLRVLVICPNTVKRTWATEIEKHAGHSDYVIPSRSMEHRITELGTARYTIVNCEALSLAPLNKAIVAYPWDLVIVDESTRFKSPKANRTKMLHKMHPAHRIVLTGTPITGKPEDAWSQLEFVSPGLFGKSFWAFTDRYLKKDWFGAIVGLKEDNAPELKSRIDAVSYRILKDQVLDLPPKVYSDRRVTMDGDQRRAYNQMRDELRIEIDALTEVRAANILTMLLRLTQVTAGLVGTSLQGYTWLGEKSAKVRELDELLNDELRGEQVVIFGQYQRELEELARRYAGGPETGAFGAWQPPIIYGPTPEPVRADLVNQFQAGQRRLLFVQSRTGGIGITLTAAQTAIYHTRSWSLEEYLQSQDRLHRIGQTGTVSIIHLRAEDSIDDDIADALTDKQQLADHLTGDTARKLAARILGK